MTDRVSEPRPSERRCGKPASEQVFWPGREPLPCCEEHARRAKAIGAVIGCHIASRTAPDGMTCTQIVTAGGTE